MGPCALKCNAITVGAMGSLEIGGGGRFNSNREILGAYLISVGKWGPI